MDRDRVEAAQRGDQAAFVGLVRSRGDRLFAIACRILRDVDRAAFNEGADLAESVIETFSWACNADSPQGPCWGDGPGRSPATPPPGG